MMRRPRRSTRTATLYPYTPLLRFRPISRTDFDRPAGRRFEHRQKTCKAGCDHCQAERREEPVEQGYACKTPALRPAPPACCANDQIGGKLFGPSCERRDDRSEEHTSELQSLMRISYAVFCLKKKKNIKKTEQQ